MLVTLSERDLTSPSEHHLDNGHEVASDYERMKPLTLLETQAALIVDRLSSGICTRLDPGGGSTPRPDFEILDDRRKRVGVLEVTSTVDPDIAAFARAASDSAEADSRLRLRWFISPINSQVSVKTLRKKIPPILEAAESTNAVMLVPTNNLNVFTIYDRAILEELAQYGAEMPLAIPTHPGEVGALHVKLPTTGGGIGPDMVNQVVSEVLADNGNLKKLQEAPEIARHELFLWLGEGTLPSMALCTPRHFPNEASSYPTTCPKLPSPITQVWVATGPNDLEYIARALWILEHDHWRVVAQADLLAETGSE